MMDRTTALIVDALKQALAEPREQVLYRTGKQPGLFASRSGANAEAAEIALREKLLEVTRTETRGKTSLEWVRPTPKAVEFLHQQESPVAALKDLQTILQVNRERLPLWLDEMQAELRAMAQRLTQETERWTHRLNSLAERVEAVLGRVESGPVLPEAAGSDAPWARDAVQYLNRRRHAGTGNPCPLPELFSALRQRQPDLLLVDFHDRLRRLRDRGVLKLLPYAGEPAGIPEPEYAMLDGASLVYFVET